MVSVNFDVFEIKDTNTTFKAKIWRRTTISAYNPPLPNLLKILLTSIKSDTEKSMRCRMEVVDHRYIDIHVIRTTEPLQIPFSA